MRKLERNLVNPGSTRPRDVVTLLTVLMLCTFGLGPAFAAEKEEPAQVSHDGLRLLPDTEAAIVYLKPDTDFTGYKRIMILEAYVAFRKGWAADQRRTSVHKVTNRDIERMKGDVGKLFREVFVEELDAKGGYAVVESADNDVLLLRPAIIDLEVAAPDLDSPGRSYNFAASAGAATLFLEVYDSVSGEILARVLDRKVASTPGHVMRWTNKVTNRAAARQVLAEWAGLLRQRLDEIHGR